VPRGKRVASAVKGRHSVPDAETNGDPSSGIIGSIQTPTPVQVFARWRVDAMHPNIYNRELFPDSLSPASVARMADDLRAHGQEQSILVRPDGTIINGERRWHGAQLLRWTEVNVVVEDVPDDQIRARILGSCSASRQMTLREQVNVYSGFVELLKKTCGRPRGRPSAETIPEGVVLMSPSEIREQAANRAMFDSVTHAERALAVFSRGDAKVRDAVSSGDMTVTAAYNELPKRPKAKRAASNESRDSNPTALPGPVEALPSGNANHVSETAAGATNAVEEGGVSHEQHIQEACDGEPRWSTVALAPSPGDEPEVLEDHHPQVNESGEPRAEVRPGRAVGPVAKPTRQALSQHRRASPDSNVVENPFDSEPLDVSSDDRARAKRTESVAGSRRQRAADNDDQLSAFDVALDVVDDFIDLLAEWCMNDAVDARDRVVRRLDATIARRAAVKGETRQVEQQAPTSDGVLEDQDADNGESPVDHDDEGTISTKMARKTAGQSSTRRRSRSSKQSATAPSDDEVDALINPWGSRK
jgi:hypothetical protein